MWSKQDLARLFDYTVWANHRAMRAAATLSVDDFKRDLKSSHGGIRGTLTHTMSAEWVWLERWKGVSPLRHFDEGEFPTLLELRDRWGVIEDHRASWLGALAEDGPAAIVSYTTFDGRHFESPLWKLVQHMSNHGTYHRGQVTTMLRQLGAKAVSTDMVLWDREPGS
jgi:uncharacterized damage-inducible protein DinB